MDSIREFLVDGYKAVSDALELSVKASIVVNDFDAIKKKYEESLTLLLI